jgi:integrase
MDRDELDSYYERWPIGTKERVWIDVLLYTGGRRGDAVRLGRQHVRDGVATFRTEKSQGEISVSIPILPILQETLDVGPTGDLAFIVGANGKPLTKESFGTLFRKACRAAGVHKSAHGCRKVAATRAAENGATTSQLNAVFGWKGVRMASLYTQEADRKRLAREAAGLLVKNTKATSIPSPSRKVRASERKPE